MAEFRPEVGETVWAALPAGGGYFDAEVLDLPPGCVTARVRYLAAGIPLFEAEVPLSHLAPHSEFAPEALPMVDLLDPAEARPVIDRLDPPEAIVDSGPPDLAARAAGARPIGRASSRRLLESRPRWGRRELDGRWYISWSEAAPPGQMGLMTFMPDTPEEWDEAKRLVDAAAVAD